MKNFHDRTVLITGAGGGIGRETALAFAAEGAQVLAADRDEPSLERTRALIEARRGRCESFVVDVGDEARMREVANTVHTRFGALDVLVNNAGIGAAGRFLETTAPTWDRVWAVNVRGVMLGCKLFVPAMVERRAGHVVNLSSMAGYFAAPEMAVYAASKFAVLGFSEALRGDLKDHGIGVTAICPGIVNTGIVASTTAEGGSARWQAGAVDFYRKRNYPPQKVAQAIVRAVRRNAAIQPVTPEAHVAYHVKRLWPALGRRLAAHPLPFMKSN